MTDKKRYDINRDMAIAAAGNDGSVPVLDHCADGYSDFKDIASYGYSMYVPLAEDLPGEPVDETFIGSPFYSAQLRF